MLITMIFAFVGAASASPSCPHYFSATRPVLKSRFDFTPARRALEVYEFGLRFKAGERNQDLIRRLEMRLVDTSDGRVVWSVEDYKNNAPTAALIDPRRPDVVFVSKGVERLYLAEDAVAGAKPHRVHPGLTTRRAHEVWRVDARGRWTELFDSDLPITALRADGDALVVHTGAGEHRISSPR